MHEFKGNFEKLFQGARPCRITLKAENRRYERPTESNQQSWVDFGLFTGKYGRGSTTIL